MSGARGTISLPWFRVQDNIFRFPIWCAKIKSTGWVQHRLGDFEAAVPCGGEAEVHQARVRQSGVPGSCFNGHVLDKNSSAIPADPRGDDQGSSSWCSTLGRRGSGDHLTLAPQIAPSDCRRRACTLAHDIFAGAAPASEMAGIQEPCVTGRPLLPKWQA